MSLSDPNSANHEPGTEAKRRRRYGNFDDVFGLVSRMLRSGESSAWWALALAGAGIVATPVDLLLRASERRLLASAGTATGPMLLIVGAPRSGTTLAYQLLARYLDASCFSNATGLFERSPIAGSWAVRGLTARRGSASFRSFYGNSAGLGAPNDGFGIWNRWLGEDRYRGPDAISDESAAQMRRFFSAWSARFQRPFLNKNNRNTDCVDLLAAALPEAVFVEIERDPVDVVQSLLKAREMVQGDATRGWGLRSTDEATRSDDPVVGVSRQVALVRDRLKAARGRVDSSRYLTIAYDEMCQDPAAFVSRVCDRYPAYAVRPDAALSELSPFSVARHQSVSDDDMARIRAIVSS